MKGSTQSWLIVALAVVVLALVVAGCAAAIRSAGQPGDLAAGLQVFKPFELWLSRDTLQPQEPSL